MIPDVSSSPSRTDSMLAVLLLAGLTTAEGVRMLPLVPFPGAGSELYRGLGSVVIGGLSLSALTDPAADPALAGPVPRQRRSESRRAAGGRPNDRLLGSARPRSR